MTLWNRLRHEPLAHFLLLGGLLFVLNAVIGGPDRGAVDRVVRVTDGDVNRLAAAWQLQWRRPPTAEELSRLVDDHVREEILYRDGIDDDCDGRADDADSDTQESTMSTFYADTDADGLGDLDRPTRRCEIVAGLVENFVDCDDRTAEITNYPFPEDADLDGYGHEINTTRSCDGYPGMSHNRDDCDDTDPWVNIPKEWYPDADGRRVRRPPGGIIRVLPTQ